jgi:hypothetical protein
MAADGSHGAVRRKEVQMMRWRISRVLLLVGAIGVLVAGLAPVADAMTGYPTGCVGSLSIGKTAGDFRDFTGQGASDYLISPAITIQRASSNCYSGTQVISAVMRIFGYGTDGWQYRKSATLQAPASVVPGYQLNIKNIAWEPSYLNVSVDVIITWRTPTGTLIGQERVDYNTVGDYYTFNTGAVGIFSDSVVGAYLHWNQ